jgi:tetratricopeptide (TPR) repeat protein
MKKKVFEEGDIFYSYYGNKYHLYKLLKHDKESNTYHVLCYTDLDRLPKSDELKALEVQIYHTPIDKDGFENPEFLFNELVTAQDLIGYHEFLRQTHSIEFVATTANEYYQRALRLTDEKKHELAIDEYSKAIDLVPQFFEAIDNRGFCKMDLAEWTDAIEDFKTSLSLNPNSLLAEFSIGECYLNLGDGKKAKEQFEKAIAIDPTHQPSHDFLKKAIELE